MIELQQVSVRSGTFRLSGMTVTVPAGCYAVLMGRSGAGKTTLLEAICGLRPVESGTIRLSGKDVSTLPPGAREVGYVPQDLALFPTMSVREHLEFALKLRRISRPDRATRVGELASLLGLEPLLDRSIRKLSGGEAQRVALGRALSFRPRILLLDEPLSALDEALRGDMQILLRQIQQTMSMTVLHVTHSLEEARTLADELLILEAGTIHPHQPGNARPE